MRERGLFGSVSVPYEVVGVAPAGALVSDLSSHRGALTFQQGESLQVKGHHNYGLCDCFVDVVLVLIVLPWQCGIRSSP